MNTLAQDQTGVQVRLSMTDLLVLSNALNEVCHGLDVPEFATRLGVERDEAVRLLQEIRDVYDEAVQQAAV
jgi:hypothetical protein